MEGYQGETSVLGKLIARSTSPTRTSHRDCASGSAETEGRDGVGNMHQREDLGEVDREREELGMTGELRVKCLWDNAVLPVRGTAGAAGYDISAASGCVIPGHGKESVDIGLAVLLPPGTYTRIAPQSGLAYRHFIDVKASIVDSDVRGEIKVILFNHSVKDFPVQVGDRIAQLILECIDTRPSKR